MVQVNHPTHYNTGSIECIDAMQSAFGDEAVIQFCKLNAFKYVWRAGNKEANTEVDDLQKAQWYLSKAIQLCSNQSKNSQ